MNKKGQSNDWAGIAFFVVVCVLVVSIIIYFLGQISFWIGIGGLIFSFILLMMSSQNGDDNLGKFALIILGVSILLIIVGLAITHFFEANEVGKAWLGGGRTVMNTTIETYKLINR